VQLLRRGADIRVPRSRAADHFRSRKSVSDQYEIGACQQIAAANTHGLSKNVQVPTPDYKPPGALRHRVIAMFRLTDASWPFKRIHERGGSVPERQQLFRALRDDHPTIGITLRERAR
jgi:hypothetical protein